MITAENNSALVSYDKDINEAEYRNKTKMEAIDHTSLRLLRSLAYSSRTSCSRGVRDCSFAESGSMGVVEVGWDVDAIVLWIQCWVESPYFYSVYSHERLWFLKHTTELN